MTPDFADDKTLQEWRTTAPFWTKHSGTIRTMFAPLTEALIQDASIGEGQTVLDVAGGAGEPSLTIAERVGSTGAVTCTDAVAEMVAAAPQTIKGEVERVRPELCRQCEHDADSLASARNLTKYLK